MDNAKTKARSVAEDPLLHGQYFGTAALNTSTPRSDRRTKTPETASIESGHDTSLKIYLSKSKLAFSDWHEVHRGRKRESEIAIKCQKLVSTGQVAQFTALSVETRP